MYLINKRMHIVLITYRFFKIFISIFYYYNINNLVNEVYFKYSLKLSVQIKLFWRNQIVYNKDLF